MRLVAFLGVWSVSTSNDAPDVKYLVPLLSYGPNNQFDGLLEATSLAFLTNRTLLLPHSFARWYRDEASPAHVPFEDVFDAAPLLATGQVAFVDAEIRALWSRKLDWSVLASPMRKQRLDHALFQLGLQGRPKHKHVVKAHSRAKDVKQQFADHARLREATFVAIAPLFVIDGERSLLLNAARLRERSQRIKDLASKARVALFGDARDDVAPLLAVHVRRESTEIGCHDGARFVVCPRPEGTVSTAAITEAIIAAAHDAGATRVYLAHAGQGAPDVAGEPDALIAALTTAGLDARTASSLAAMTAATAPLDRDLTPFDVSLVEQEICATAAAFSASAQSTWSATVSFDREARSRRNMRHLDVPPGDRTANRAQRHKGRLRGGPHSSDVPAAPAAAA